MKAKFLRFVVTEHHERSRQPSGLFSVAYKLVRSGELPSEEAEALREAMEWFEANVPAPQQAYITERYIFWYKIEAQECIRRMWRLADLLKMQGYLVEVEKCFWPGTVIYDDALQVAARPVKR